MNSETLIGIGGIITAILTGIGAIIASRRSAKKDEVTLLREEINRLQCRITELTDTVDKWQKRYNSLFNYVLLLRTTLINNNLDIPMLEEEDNPLPVSPAKEGEELKASTTKKKPIKIRGAVPPELMPKPSNGTTPTKPEEGIK